ncbi:unnamed protein product [Dibothriocephalus latus]|uniref:Uncharacterized protein n=1 Tax=Dibothriocephalus latus TaxID=60516 RepID=A0A3P6UTJ4_DIBLA|nr:unnamed protein product [Dibothriocephalus latus]
MLSSFPESSTPILAGQRIDTLHLANWQNNSYSMNNEVEIDVEISGTRGPLAIQVYLNSARNAFLSCLKHLLARLALAGIAIAVIWMAFKSIPEQNSSYLFVVLGPQLTELSIFMWKFMVARGNLRDEEKGLRMCVFTFLYAICPAICMMEYHRMNEFQRFYGVCIIVFHVTQTDEIYITIL